MSRPAALRVGARRAAGLFRAAVALLTRFPIRPRTDAEEDLRAAQAFFPAVGALVAGVGIAARAAMGPLVGLGPATVVAVAAIVVATGAFHEDGLADCADGLWGGWTPESRLEIMHDSRIGTYGAAALVIALALRFALLAALAIGEFARVALAGHVLGRAAGVVIATTLRPAGSPGLGATVIGPARPFTTLAVTITALCAAAYATGRWMLVPLAAAGAVVAAVRSVPGPRRGDSPETSWVPPTSSPSLRSCRPSSPSTARVSADPDPGFPGLRSPARRVASGDAIGQAPGSPCPQCRIRRPGASPKP